MVIRPATEADLPAVLPVFEAAKAIMRADGNHDQWGAPGFPGDALLLRDIARGGGFVISSEAEGEVEKSIVAYFALLPSPEPTYDVIDGAWLTDGPYGVIHRIASYPEVHGIFSAVIDFAAARYPHLRIDTHRDNRIMQHLIDMAGFTYCGVIWLEDGTERLAYER
ncbi:MAG: N-acetyltransferase [Bacteroidales bacterium]|nr:N-acetyltransferase [Bacteroidales bacterium]